MKTLICIPAMDSVNTSFLRCLLNLRPVGDVRFAITQSSLIYDARNLLAKQAIQGEYDRTLWLDSDMLFDSDLMERLSARMDEGHDLVTGLYFTRKPPYRPVLFKECRVNEAERKCNIVWYDQYPSDSVFPIEACGFGGVMVTVELLKRIKEAYGTPFSPISGWGEDLSFCMRAQGVGADMVCDSSAKMGHTAHVVINEETFKENQSCLQK